MNEFDFIAQQLAPLSAKCSGSFALADDAALPEIPAGNALVVTKDALAEGVHFTGGEPAAQVAQKLLRVNLSDLAAMGATPLCYFLALMLPQSINEKWLKDFVSGLAADQQDFSIALAGGDTTRSSGSLCMSITALGTVPHGQELRRNGAQAGDDIYVSGTIGDAALGLQLEQKNLYCAQSRDVDFLLSRYRIPQPRLTLGTALRGVASAAIDISDGLAADMEHICDCSAVGAVINTTAIPLSPATGRILEYHPDLWQDVLSGGDDYELCFTAAPQHKSRIEKISSSLDLPLTRIGEITAGDRLRLLDRDNNEITLPSRGYKHF